MLRSRRPRPTIARSLAALGISALLVAAGGCSDDSSSPGGCTDDAGCDRFSVCLDSVCTAVSCSSSTQCAPDQTCAADLSGNRFCTAFECGTAENPSCPPNEVCEAGICIEPCASDLDCDFGLVCETGLCVPGTSGGCTGAACDGQPCASDAECGGLSCIGGVCGEPEGCASNQECQAGEICDVASGTCVPDPDIEAGCPETPCDEGFLCNEETGECEEEVAGGGDGLACQGCETDENCSDGLICTPLAGGKYCLVQCGSDSDCTTGYQCLALQNDAPRCFPGAGSCDKDCIQNGCDANQVCDFETGDCVAQLSPCDSCTKDDFCGPGFRCVQFAPMDRRCMPECEGDAQTCPEGSACQLEGSLDICKPTGAQCCYADQCADGPECGGRCPEATPYCFQDACVQCLNSTQCPGAQACNNDTKTCEAPQGSECGTCPPTEPFCHPQTNECVACFNSSQCPEGELCTSTSTCQGADDPCSFCVAPYPACAVVAGEETCVQCIQDSDCPSGECDEATFFCEGGNLPTSGDCTTDADCPLHPEFILKCDTGTGLCYDIEGRCDNVTSYCNGESGSECISIFDLLGVDATTLPADLGVYGLCTCNPSCGGPLEAIFCTPADPQGTCFNGLQCDLLSSLIGGLLGGGSGSSCGPL